MAQNALPGEPAGPDPRVTAALSVARILAEDQDDSELAQRILDALARAFQADAGFILWGKSKASGRVSVAAALGYNLAALRQVPLRLEETPFRTLLAQGRPAFYPTSEAIQRLFADLSPEARAGFAAAAGGQAQAALCLPLTADEGSAGLLILETRQLAGRLGEEDAAFWQEMGRVVALALARSDLTDLSRVQRAVAALDAGSDFGRELISILAHEMRTPLTSIKGYASALLMEEASFDQETQREFLRIIEEETDVLQELIRDLLESSSIEAGHLTLELEPVIVPRLAQSVVAEIAHRAGNHRFLLDFPPDFPEVVADGDRVKQVFRNLLENAVKYSPAGGLVVVRGEVSEHEVTISVADEGIGIAPEHLNRLFEKFFRVRSHAGQRVVGTGLGLPIARAIVESHGGRIWAQSQLGQGSTFFFTLPLGDDGRRPATSPGGVDSDRNDDAPD